MSEEESSSDEGSLYEEEDNETDEEDDIRNMSEAGGRLNDADRRMVARYIADFDGWDKAGSQKSRWEAFADSVRSFRRIS